MATEEVGLNVSPFVTRVEFALKLKRVAYELVTVEIYGQKSEILLKSNPVYKKIPVLIHRGKPICESAIIVQYIDEPSVLPSDSFDPALARFWTGYIDDKLPTPTRILIGAADAADKAEAAAQAAEVLRLLEEPFTKCGHGRDFFGGDTIGYLDIALGSWLGWIEAMEKMNNIKLLDEKKVPLLVGWAERFFQGKAVKEVMPDVDDYIEFAKMLNAASALGLKFVTIVAV